MQETIYKYPLTLDGFSEEIEMPLGARILTLQTQGDIPTLWAIVDPRELMETRLFGAIGTGHPVPANGSYVGTWQDGPYVWHLFEITEDK